jgi:F420-dependent oxidoreductase-like protein
MRPLFGFHMPDLTFPGSPPESRFERIVEFALAAEAAGFDLLTVMDHFYQIRGVGPEDAPMLEAYTTLAGIAARTSRIRLGTMVTGVTYRNPALLAKTVTTLDIVSGGRAVLGLGAAWNESEHRGYGFEFPPIGERMDRLDEALTICRLMFTEERPTFEGRHYRIDGALNSPRPLQPGGPRVLIGGGGEKRTLRLVARHADLSHWFSLAEEDLKRKHALLDGYLAEEGRDPASVTRTMAAPVLLVEREADAAAALERVPPERRAALRPLTPDHAAERLSELMGIGFGGFTFSDQTLRTPEAVALAGEVIRQLS